MTPGTELGLMSKTKNGQSIIKYKEILFNSYSYVKMGDTRFFIFRDVWTETECPGCSNTVALGLEKEGSK